MLNIATIGIGNAGNQVAELAFNEKQIPGLAINSSQKDLSNVKSIMKMTVGDERGAGKNRDEAKRFIKEQIANLLIMEEFATHIKSADVIFIISSIAGGTGSGMAPIFTDIMCRKFKDKQFILVEIYPPLHESIAAQQNSLDYLKEVQQFIPNCTYMAYDNQKKADRPTSEMMKAVNREIVDHMSIIRGDYLYSTPYNSIDEKDMLKILETPGRLATFIVDGIKEKDLDNKSIEDMVIHQIKNVSSAVELDRDKIVKRMGIITNLNDKINAQFTGINKIKELVGEPVEGFEHVYIGQKDEDNRIIVIVSGLSVPDDRLEKITQRITEGLEELAKTKSSSVLDSVETGEIKALRDNARGVGELNLDELFSKY